MLFKKSFFILLFFHKNEAILLLLNKFTNKNGQLSLEYFLTENNILLIISSSKTSFNMLSFKSLLKIISYISFSIKFILSSKVHSSIVNVLTLFNNS
jgi:hypothetical protein